MADLQCCTSHQRSLARAHNPFWHPPQILNMSYRQYREQLCMVQERLLERESIWKTVMIDITPLAEALCADEPGGGSSLLCGAAPLTEALWLLHTVSSQAGLANPAPSFCR